MRIYYTVVDSPLGWLLVAATDRGICSVMLGDTREEAEESLRRRFPGAEIVPDDELLWSRTEAVLCLLGGEEPKVELALDARGTPFQMRVWEELRRIPAGRTITYGQLAGRIGKPNACRAVAGACAANPVALLTPCHRVIRSDGGLGGYRWGVGRKRALLEMEKGVGADSDCGA